MTTTNIITFKAENWVNEFAEVAVDQEKKTLEYKGYKFTFTEKKEVDDIDGGEYHYVTLYGDNGFKLTALKMKVAGSRDNEEFVVSNLELDRSDKDPFVALGKMLAMLL